MKIALATRRDLVPGDLADELALRGWHLDRQHFPPSLHVTVNYVHAQVAAGHARLCLAAVDDLAGCVERPNHPGTLADEQPNWRRRLPLATADLVTGTPGGAIVQAFIAARVSH